MTADYLLSDLETLFPDVEGTIFLLRLTYHLPFIIKCRMLKCKSCASKEQHLVSSSYSNYFKEWNRHPESPSQKTHKGLVGTIFLQDNVLVHGTTRSQFEMRWSAVKFRLKDKGLTINGIKSEYTIEKINFLSFPLSENGFEPDDRLVKQVKKI